MSGAPAWRVAGVSLRGAGHVKTGQPCQDFHAFDRLPDGTLIAVLADGAGSAALAEVGAELAVRTALDSMRAALEDKAPADAEEEAWGALLRDAFRAALAAVEREAASREAQARDLACTLSLAVARAGVVAAAQIGDGSVVAADGEAKLLSLLRPSSGEYLNETTFLISPGALEQIQVACRVGAVTRVAMLSDGLQMLALKVADGEPHAPFFEPLLRFVAAEEDEAKATADLAAFLGSERVRSRADDDLTLILAALAG